MCYYTLLNVKHLWSLKHYIEPFFLWTLALSIIWRQRLENHINSTVWHNQWFWQIRQYHEVECGQERNIVITVVKTELLYVSIYWMSYMFKCQKLWKTYLKIQTRTFHLQRVCLRYLHIPHSSINASKESKDLQQKEREPVIISCFILLKWWLSQTNKKHSSVIINSLGLTWNSASRRDGSVGGSRDFKVFREECSSERAISVSPDWLCSIRAWWINMYWACNRELRNQFKNRSAQFPVEFTWSNHPFMVNGNAVLIHTRSASIGYVNKTNVITYRTVLWESEGAMTAYCRGCHSLV